MSDPVEYRIGQASEAEIATHLKSCDDGFVKQLSDRGDINSYAHKIADKAHRCEAWTNSGLAGLVAVYCNAQERNTAFITSVSVLPGWQGRGIALRLMEDCIEHVFRLGFAYVELEVARNNKAAITFYGKRGFTIIDQPGLMLKMTLDLGGGERR
jgi:ribosomal-protein-alanine N-acetyltransferase